MKTAVGLKDIDYEDIVFVNEEITGKVIPQEFYRAVTHCLTLITIFPWDL